MAIQLFLALSYTYVYMRNCDLYIHSYSLYYSEVLTNLLITYWLKLYNYLHYVFRGDYNTLTSDIFRSTWLNVRPL